MRERLTAKTPALHKRVGPTLLRETLRAILLRLLDEVWSA